MSNSNEILVEEILTNEFALSAPVTKVDFINHLAIEINRLIQYDFQRLINILYRLDVSEEKLKEMLTTYVHEDAGYIIAQLVVERQLQKLKTRQQMRRDENIGEEDKW